MKRWQLESGDAKAVPPRAAVGAADEKFNGNKIQKAPGLQALGFECIFNLACLKKRISMNSKRRTFLITLAAGSAAFTSAAYAQAKLDEKDRQAVALGYVADATKVDTKKYPKYAAGQVCNNCALYQGKVTDAWGGCPLFSGKQVAGKGWCSAWVKKG